MALRFLYRLLPLLSLFFIGLVTNLSAHETWLLPVGFSVEVNESAEVDLTSGMAFPAPDHAISEERVSRAFIRLGEDKVAVGDVNPLNTSLRFVAPLPRAGLATVWIELRPRDIELTDEEVSEYLDEIGASDETRAAWSRLRGNHAWKETYTKHAKTFVAAGDTGSDQSWREPVGMGFEIVPLSHPLELRVGEEAQFHLLKNGAPLASATVGMLVEGTDERVFQTTDAQGRVTFPVDRAGRMLVFAVDLQLAENGVSWESDFTTLTGRVED